MRSELIHLNIFDLHCDTFSEMYGKNRGIYSESLAVNEKSFENYGASAQNFAVWISGREPPDKSLELYKKTLEYGRKRLVESGKFGIVTGKKQFKNTIKSGKTAALLSVEGCGFVRSADDADMLHSDGIRIVSLTWNFDNNLAGGAHGNGHLTPLGERFIERLNDLGMILDLSHLNRTSFYEAAEVGKNIAVTHTGFDGLIKNLRNLDDKQLHTVAQKNGIVGICVYPKFIGDNPVFGFCNAVKYAVSRGLEKVIAFGSDFDGAKMDDTLKSTADVPKLLAVLQAENVDINVTEGLFYRNAADFFSRCCSTG